MQALISKGSRLIELPAAGNVAAASLEIVGAADMMLVQQISSHSIAGDPNDLVKFCRMLLIEKTVYHSQSTAGMYC